MQIKTNISFDLRATLEAIGSRKKAMPENTILQFLTSSLLFYYCYYYYYMHFFVMYLYFHIYKDFILPLSRSSAVIVRLSRFCFPPYRKTLSNQCNKVKIEKFCKRRPCSRRKRDFPINHSRRLFVFFSVSIIFTFVGLYTTLYTHIQSIH